MYVLVIMCEVFFFSSFSFRFAKNMGGGFGGGGTRGLRAVCFCFVLGCGL